MVEVQWIANWTLIKTVPWVHAGHTHPIKLPGPLQALAADLAVRIELAGIGCAKRNDHHATNQESHFHRKPPWAAEWDIR
jgi:hypothetical protein